MLTDWKQCNASHNCQSINQYNTIQYRHKLYTYLTAQQNDDDDDDAICYAFGIVSNERIDSINNVLTARLEASTLWQ